MNATELRIGNQVKRKNKNTSKEEVINLTASDVLDISSNGVKSSFVYTPIPLTEDILLSLGFTHNNSINEYGDLLVNNYTLTIDKYSTIAIEDDFSFGIESQKESVIFENDILKSVHRLQNLYFALTNKELTINL